jgi:hypothetical protein
MKRTFLAVAILSSYLSFAQDTIVTQQKWRGIFEDAGFKEEYYKLTGGAFDKTYLKNNFYTILVVFRDPMMKSIEGQVQVKSLLDLCDPASPLQLRRQLQNGTYEVSKSELETFIFDKYIFRRETPGPYNFSDAWGIVYLNGPIYSLKTFGLSKYSSGTEGYATIKFKHTLQNMKDETSLSYNDLHKVQSNIRFKARMRMDFKEAPELVQKIEADTEGYGKPDYLKMILEYNEYIREHDPERYNASIYPKVRFKKK